MNYFKQLFLLLAAVITTQLIHSAAEGASTRRRFNLVITIPDAKPRVISDPSSPRSSRSNLNTPHSTGIIHPMPAVTQSSDSESPEEQSAEEVRSPQFLTAPTQEPNNPLQSPKQHHFVWIKAFSGQKTAQ